MDFQKLLTDKSIKPKEKTEALSRWLLTHPEKINDLVDFAGTSKDPAKATCIEAIEFATKKKPEIASAACLDFVSKSLTEKAPRIKWESAKVIGNIAHLYPGKLDEAIANLLVNAEHEGTVVRWSAAFALAQIIKIKTVHHKTLVPAVESICNREEKNSIKKIYAVALKETEVA
ncbi:MAG: HEAT repeat domain-containing protein [Bacteroidetes bacterium]|nr:HEAT repeat domain-containing protein [Bacteroidota bacterium]